MEWTKKQDPSICCLQENHFRHKDTCRLEGKGWKTIFHANRSQKKSQVINTYIRDETDFKIDCKREKCYIKKKKMP